MSKIVRNIPDGLEASYDDFPDVVRYVDTIADLANVDTDFRDAGGVVIVTDKQGDNRAFKYDASKASLNNGGTIFDGWARTNIKDRIFTHWFGAIGDGVTDDSANVQKALNVAIEEGLMLDIGNNIHLIETTITLDQFRGTSNVQVNITGNVNSNNYQDINSKSGFIAGDSLGGTPILLLDTCTATTGIRHTATLENFNMYGNSRDSVADRVSTAIRGQLSYMNISKVGIQGFNVALHQIESYRTSISHCAFTYNNIAIGLSGYNSVLTCNDNQLRANHTVVKNINGFLSDVTSGQETLEFNTYSFNNMESSPDVFDFNGFDTTRNIQIYNNYLEAGTNALLCETGYHSNIDWIGEAKLYNFLLNNVDNISIKSDLTSFNDSGIVQITENSRNVNVNNAGFFDKPVHEKYKLPNKYINQDPFFKTVGGIFHSTDSVILPIEWGGNIDIKTQYSWETIDVYRSRNAALHIVSPFNNANATVNIPIEQIPISNRNSVFSIMLRVIVIYKKKAGTMTVKYSKNDSLAETTCSNTFLSDSDYSVETVMIPLTTDVYKLTLKFYFDDTADFLIAGVGASYSTNPEEVDKPVIVNPRIPASSTITLSSSYDEDINIIATPNEDYSLTIQGNNSNTISLSSDYAGSAYPVISVYKSQ